ncbi:MULTISPECIES: helix-turn-helix domain-containing protein [Sphingobacterium]|uniref:AraC family transcriptional regulator n=1 Tax=Sphingobacterium tenebrionis TaxID=3111775 RepID=A0ABU8I3B6_9SPHI|nr:MULTISPECIES: AraC family transcriptional regulator [unclassified Sphingobacterium]QBR11772.1 AraC family transcriptional regulator [Sphingobacterium sp. CZ-2]
MIIKQLEVPKQYNESFQIRRDYAPRHHQIWHYHDELEIVHILKGSGTLFIGDRIKPVQPGETVLIPAQIAHYWLFEEDVVDNPEPHAIDCLVIHFKKDLGIERFFSTPELLEIKTLIDQSERGYFFDSNSYTAIQPLFEHMLVNQGLDRFIAFLKFLSLMQNSPKEELTSENYSILHQSEDQFRMNSLMEYLRENYKQKIKLADLAGLAGLTENSFCRYFKQKTGKTPVQFITELRISHACSQLRNSKLSLKEICYDSGFNNFVSFHKNFKSIIGQTPLQFRQA